MSDMYEENKPFHRSQFQYAMEVEYIPHQNSPVHNMGKLLAQIQDVWPWVRSSLSEQNTLYILPDRNTLNGSC
jgi:hypothetical protein